MIALTTIQIFFWLSYIIIVFAACIIVGNFVVSQLEVFKSRIKEPENKSNES